MSWMERISGGYLGVLALVLATFCGSLAQGAQLSIPSLSEGVGKELKVPLILYQGQDVSNLQIALSWNPSILAGECRQDESPPIKLLPGVHLRVASCFDLNPTTRYTQFILECDQQGCGGSEPRLAELEFEVLREGDCSVFIARASVNGSIEVGTGFGGTPIPVQVGSCRAKEPLELPEIKFTRGEGQDCTGPFVLENKESPLPLALPVELGRISSLPVCVKLALYPGKSPTSFKNAEITEIPPGARTGEARASLSWDEGSKYGHLESGADIEEYIILQPVECEGASQVNAKVGPSNCLLQKDSSPPDWCSAVLWAFLAGLFGAPLDAGTDATFLTDNSDLSRRALVEKDSSGAPLAILRSLRDQVMASSATGRFYTDLLEQNNSGLIVALISSDALIETITQEYPPWLDGIQALLDGVGEDYVITADMVAGLQAILDGFKENGSEELRKTIEFEEDRLGISSLAGLTMNQFLAQVTERGGVLHELNFAQYADGPTITSDIVVYNPSQTEMATGNVALFDLDGEAIDPALVLVEGNSAFELPPLGSVTFAGKGSSDQLRVGSATVKADRPVSGVIRFFIKGVGVAGVGSSTPMMEVVAPVRRQGRLSTGVAIQNNVNEEITVDLQLKDEAGVEVGGGSSQRTLPAWGRLAEFIETLFPEADTTGFKGVITVRSQAGTIAVIALELETGAEPKFTTLPVSPLEP